tara:strand:+ start:49699 stop:52434 length:2736 start_codon:yes stop_codon:yes gene_type:complete
MKKFTFQIFAILAFAITWQANAQFTESFETEIPATWTVINGGGSNAWVQSSSPNGGAQDGAGVASISYNSTAHNDYLITPAIAVTANTNDRLSFYVKSRSSSFLESYEVLLSTTDALEASFTTVLQASSEAPNAWTQLTFSLSAYVGQTIYVALRATGTDEFNLYADNFVNDAAPACTPTVVDSSTVVDDCGSSQFSVDVVVSTVGDGSVITDGLGGSFPIVAGTVNAGPYTFGDVITLTVEHSDSDCDFELGDFESECTLPGEICENSIIIGALPYTTTDNTSNYGDDYGSADEPCSTSGYLTGDDVVYSFTPVTDMSVNMTTSGTGSWTGLFIYEQCPFVTCVDSDTQSSGNPSIPEVSLVGGTTYYIVISTYPSPQSTAYTLDITENTCTAASATFTVISDCIVSGGFLVEVDVTDLGTATALTISDDQANPSQPLTAIGTLTFGPYVNGTDVVITINDDNDDDSCTVTSSAITQAVCPPSNVDCANATPIACGETINATSVGSTGNSEDIGCSMGSNGLWFTFVGTGGDITVASTASFDHRQGIASGSCGSLVNIVCDDQSTGAETHTFASTLGETYYVYIARYSSGSTVTGTIDITLTCAVVPTCTPADATATVVEDCVAETYVVNVDVTTVGNATEISDGIATYPISGTGIIAVGPYATGTPVTLNIVHDDADCDFTLGTYNFVCPPVNDDIMNPVKLEAGSAVCEDPVIGTNVGATDSVEAGASCGTPEGDVWFQIEIPNTGEITVETSSSGGISDTVMAIYSGMPGSLVEVDCDDDGGTGSFSSIALTGQTPGNIYYVRVWEYQNNAFGTFSICAWSPTTLSVDTNVIEGFSYYPNPVNNVLNVKAQTNISNVTVYNMLGQEVLRTAPNTVASEVDMSNLQTGAYFVKVTIGGATKTIRVIKN